MSRRRGQSIVRWVITASVLIVVVVGGGWAAIRYTSPVVVTTEAVEAPVVQAFYSTGTIQPEREFPIKSNTAGTVTDVRVDKGDHVKKGQVLALVSDPGLLFLFNKAQAELDERLK